VHQRPQCVDRAAGTGGVDVLCDPSGACVQCRGDLDCNGETPTCDGGACVAPPGRDYGSLNLGNAGGRKYLTAGWIKAYDLPGSFTIEAWIWPTARGINGLIAGRGDAHGGVPAWGIWLDHAGSPFFYIADSPNGPA
jgi:hypothetical protein